MSSQSTRVTLYVHINRPHVLELFLKKITKTNIYCLDLHSGLILTNTQLLFSSHINEYKRKTDSQVQMFEIIQDIDNCPVSPICYLIVESVSFVLHLTPINPKKTIEIINSRALSIYCPRTRAIYR